MVVLSCRFDHFSISEMAADEAAKKTQVDQLKAEILEARITQNRLGNEGVSREQLLTFDMLECLPLVTDQTEMTFQWGHTDALYEFVHKLPAWVVDDDIMEAWSTGAEDTPQCYKGWDTEKVEWGQALLLSWVSLRLSGGAASEDSKVFTAVVVCIHPFQDVVSIRDGTGDLVYHSVNSPGKCMSALCRLPRRSVKTFYPSPLNDSYLVVPYFREKRGREKKVHLDSTVMLNKHLLVRRLHRQPGKGGDEAVVPPVFSKDPGILGMLAVGYMGPMWVNVDYISTENPLSKNPLPSISEVCFCADKYVAKRSLVPLEGAGVVYSPACYDRDGKLLKVNRPADEDEAVPEDESEKVNLPPSTPHDDDDAKLENNAASKQASDSGSASGSNSGSGSDSGSNSGSSDSSRDSPSNKSSADSPVKSDARGDTRDGNRKRRVRRKKKTHQSSDSDELNPVSKGGGTDVKANEAGEMDSRDSGVGNGGSATVTSGDGAAVTLGLRHIAGARKTGALPLPSTLLSMASVRTLTDDLEKIGDKLFQDLEETSIDIYDKVLKGFKDTSGKCKEFIHEMGARAIAFFNDAKELEGGLAECDARAFGEAMDASKNHILGLLLEVSEAKEIYEKGEANFDNILASVAKEVKDYIQSKGKEQRKAYKAKCLDRIEKDHGRLDGATFVPMIVGNLAAHCAFAMSLRVLQSGGASEDHIGTPSYSGWFRKNLHAVHGISVQAGAYHTGEVGPGHWQHSTRV